MISRLISISVVTILLVLSTAASAEISIIVHPSNDTSSLSKKDVKKIFLGKKKKFSNGNKIVPLSQDDDSTVTEEFNSNVLKKSDSQLKSYWSKLVFTGKGAPPKAVGGDADVLKLVGGNPDMIGFIDSAAVDSSVKVVFKF